MHQRPLVITVADDGPELFHIADALCVIGESVARGELVHWARGVESDSKPYAGAIGEGPVRVQAFDFGSSDAAQQVVVYGRRVNAQGAASEVCAFGLGTASRIGILLARALRVRATVFFNAYQLKRATARCPYLAAWCARRADTLLATETLALEGARAHLPPGVKVDSIALPPALQNGRTAEVAVVANSDHACDRAVVASLRRHYGNVLVVDQARPSVAGFAFPVGEIQARLGISIGCDDEVEALGHFVRAARWIHVPRRRLTERTRRSTKLVARRFGPADAHSQGGANGLPHGFAGADQVVSTWLLRTTTDTTEFSASHAAPETNGPETDRWRILFVTYGYPPEPGGVPESSDRLVRLLRGAGHDVVVIAPECDGAPHKTGLFRIGPHSWQSEHELDAILHVACVEHRRRPFHLVLGFFLVPAGLFAVLIARRFGIPSLVSVRGNDVSKYLFLSPARTDWVLKHASALVAVSPDLRDLVNAVGAARAPCRLVPNSIDLPLNLPAVRPVRRERPLVGIAGIVRWKKGWRPFVEAIAQLGPRVQGRIVGDLVDQERADFDRLQTALGCSIERTGLVPEREMPRLLSELDVFVSPSLDDGMPNTLLKAVRASVPVVVTAIGGHLMLIKDRAHGVIVPPGDARQLAEGIIEALREPQRTERAVRAGRTLWREFGPAAEYNAYSDVIRRLLGQCAPHPPFTQSHVALWRPSIQESINVS